MRTDGTRYFSSARALLGLLLLGTAASTALAEDAKGHGAPWRFEHLTTEDGLSNLTVYSLLQDDTGFLWIGTEGGLNRYDGRGFEILRHDPDDPNSLASDDISFMLQDREGMIWLATWGGGLQSFDPVTERFYRIGEGPGPAAATELRDIRVQHLMEDSAGVLWIGTFAGGLARFDRAAGEIEIYRHDPDDPTSLCHDRVWRVLEDSVKTLWVATSNGLCLLDRASNRFRAFRHDPDDPRSLSDNKVRTLLADRSGDLWIGTEGGLNRLDRRALTFDRFQAGPDGLSHDVITALFEDSRGRLWVGTRGGGLNLRTSASEPWQHIRRDLASPNSLSDEDVRVILEDHAHILWIGTRQGGLNKLDLESPQFELVNGSGNASDASRATRIRAFAEDQAGRLWIGTAQGVDRWEPASGRSRATPESLPSQDIHNLLIDQEGSVWVGAGHSGLHQLAANGSLLASFRHDAEDPRSLAADLVTALYEDRAGNLWVGTTAGLDRFERATRTFVHLAAATSNLQDNYVTALLQDANGDLWIGTHNGGVHRKKAEGGALQPFRHDSRDPDSLSSNRIFAIHQPESGDLWLGTANGLNKWDERGSFVRYGVNDGLPEPQIFAIRDDGQGRLWLATAVGLTRFDPRDGTFRNFTSRDGLQNGSFNVGAAITRADGRLCFGGNNGYNCFDPSRVVEPRPPPRLVLAALQTLGQTKELARAPWATRELELAPDESFFSLELAVLDFTRPEDNRVSYKLEGHDPDWIDAGTDSTARYADLAPGRYLFRARGANSDAVWSEDELTLAISISPPFWQTPWFRGSILLLVLSAAIGAYQIRIRSLTRREERLARRVEDGLAELRRSEERYRALFERNLAGVVRVTLDGKLIDCNEAFARILGYESPASCQQHHRLQLDAGLLARLQADHSVAGFETSAQTKDGSIVTLLWNANLVAGTQDEPAVVEGTVIDVSERQRIEEGLRRAQKLESLGVLAGGIAHDFNNLLMSILGNTELGKRELDPASDLHQRLNRIEQAAQRAADLSRQMLAYSGKGEFVVSRIDLSASIDDMAHLFEGAVSKKAEIVYQLDRNLPAVEADSGQVEQVLMSLVTNASEALSSAGGTITISTGSGYYSADDLADTYLDDQLPAGLYTYLRVADDGSGMDEDLQLKIFDPFFTTKFTGRGLGLAAVLGIVRGHRGAIRINSAPEHGSTFTVLFPAARVIPFEESSATHPMPLGHGCVLVVDDEESVRQIAQDMLETLGFTTLSAADGQAGVESFRQHVDSIELVILDLAMPRMSGEEAYDEIRKISEVPVILASGYDERESTRLFTGRGLSGFIQKPYQLSDLERKVRKVLGNAHRSEDQSPKPETLE